MSTLSVRSIVDVSIQVSPSAPVARGFGVGLVLGTTAVLPLEERVRVYTDPTSVGGDFAATDPEYLAAKLYFGQEPAPRQLAIGRMFGSGSAGHLRGSATVSKTIGDYSAISNGGFDISIDGVSRQLFGVDLSDCTSLSMVATAVQTALRALVADSSFTYEDGYFLLTSPTVGVSSTVGFAAAPTGGSSPTNISTLLGLTAAAGARSYDGIAAESIDDALSACRLFNQNWYGVGLWNGATAQQIEDAQDWAEAAKVIFFYTALDPNALVANDTTNLFYRSKNTGLARSCGVHSTELNAGFSAMARMFVVDYDQPNSITTLKFKQLPLVPTATITETERLALESYNANYYADFGGFPMLAQGVVGNGRFVDEVIALDWLQAKSQNALFTAVATTPTRIAQTDEGVTILTAALKGALDQAVANGLCAPGVWRGQNIGQIKTGDFLENGYYIFAQPVAQMSTADRGARKAPAITAILIGAGAIHSVAVSMTFQR